MVKSKVQLEKVEKCKWNIIMDGENVGTCESTNKYHGSYEATLKNGLKINAFNQQTLKRLIEVNI